jgi:hypothetical protein
MIAFRVAYRLDPGEIFVIPALSRLGSRTM